MKSGNDYEIFEKMSVGDNLILPSLRKIPRLVYMVSGDKMSEILSEEMEHESLINNDIVYHLDKIIILIFHLIGGMYLILKQLYFMNRLPVVMPMEFLLYCLILKNGRQRNRCYRYQIKYRIYAWNFGSCIYY